MRNSDIDFTSDDFFGDTKKKKKDDEVKCAVTDNHDSKPAEALPLLTPTKDTDNETEGMVEAVEKDETDNADKTGDDAETDDDEDDDPVIEIIEPAEPPMPSLFDDLFVEEEGGAELLATADNDDDDCVEVPVVAVPPSQRYKIPDVNPEQPLFSSAPVGKLDDETEEIGVGEADMKPVCCTHNCAHAHDPTD